MPKRIQASDEVHNVIYDFIFDYQAKHRKKLTVNHAIRTVFEHYNTCVKGRAEGWMAD